MILGSGPILYIVAESILESYFGHCVKQIIVVWAPNLGNSTLKMDFYRANNA